MSMNSSPCKGNSLPFNHTRSRMNTSHNETRATSMADLQSVTSPKHPEPFLSIPAQALVQDSCRVHCGMVRKENKFNNWQDRYLVLHKGCVYYYKDSTDKKSQGQFSLGGYRLSTAPEKTKYEWTFKLTHIQPEKRKYFFSAHSQKELSEWLDKITEDIQEYCESVGPNTRPPGYTPEPIQDMYSSCSSSGSGDDTDKDYDYPLVNPQSFKQIKEQLKQINSTVASRVIATAIPDAGAMYCPPPAVFLRELNSSVKSSSSSLPSTVTRISTTIIQQTEHKNVTITGAGKASVDVSACLKREDTIGKSVTLPATPPRPVTRRKTSQDTNRTSEGLPDNRPKVPPQVPPRPTPPKKPLPRPPTAGAPRFPARSSESCEEDSEEYLRIIPDEKRPAPPVTNRPALLRMRPDGNSFKESPTEAAPYVAEDVLPDSAERDDLNKTDASPLLLGKEGVYMIHSSRGGDIKKALSVFSGEKVKHFLIFRNNEGYALDPGGPRFKTKRNMLVYYHEKPLPNQERAKLIQPYT